LRRLFTLLAAIYLAVCSGGQLRAQSPSLMTLVKAARLLDPRTEKVLSPATVLIDNGKIKEGATRASSST